MRTLTISAIFVLVLAQMASAAQSLTVNGEAVDEVTLKTGQSCIVKIVSDNSNPYSVYVGFDDRVVLGSFGPAGKYPEAGDLASITEYDIPAFYGYFASAAGTSPPPSPGNHFVILYQPQQVGETELKLYDITFTSVIDSVYITVVPAQMGTAFTYQGRLMEAGHPTEGQHDFTFVLYDSPSGGNQLQGKIDINDLDVINGYFTVEIDFTSSVFDGNSVWLEIGVRPGGNDDPNAFVTLNPRQRVMPTPYALQTRGIFVDDSNNVGIGTTNPLQKLHVADAGVASLVVHETDNDVVGQLQADTEYVSLHSAFNHPLRFKINDITRMFIDTNGNVGIGTENPTRDLHIYRDSGPAQIGIVTADTSTKAQVIFGDGTGNQWTISSDNTDDNKLHFRSGHASGTPRVTCQQDGNVGIGTTSPAAKLDVNGYIQTHDDLPFSVKRYTGTLGSTSSLLLQHGITNGHYKCLIVQAWCRTSEINDWMWPMIVEYINETHIMLSAPVGISNTPYRVTVIYTNNSHSW